jgi:hypothetical protein
MTEISASELEQRIAVMREEHRSLESRLNGMVNDPLVDDLEIQALKKQKLALKDSIATMESRLTA